MFCSLIQTYQMASVEFLKQHSLMLARSKRKFFVLLGLRFHLMLSRTAIFAANFAIGYPVALDANADERLTRGFTSIT